MQDLFYTRYKPHPFQLLDLYIEKPMSTTNFSVGLEAIYANYHPDLDDTRYDILNRKGFHDRSYALGIIGRWYTKPHSFRFFAEVGLHANYVHIKEPVVIEHYYGTYIHIIENRQSAISGTLAIGFSIGSKLVRWEPYIQYGVISDIYQSKGGVALIGSVGRIEGKPGIIFSLANIKIRL